MIEPELTPGEAWGGSRFDVAFMREDGLVEIDGVFDPKVLVAKCLQDQPFTWEDVAVLRDIAAPDIGTPLEGDARALTSLADRIEALLPPADTP